MGANKKSVKYVEIYIYIDVRVCSYVHTSMQKANQMADETLRL